MAYFTDYSGYGDESPDETRKRRLAMAAALMGGGGGDLLGQAGDYLQSRVAPVQQLVENPGQYLQNRLGMPSGVSTSTQEVSQPVAQTFPVAPPPVIESRPLEPEVPAQPIQPEQAVAPATRAATMPVSGSDIFNRIIQTESRGQHFDKNGNILTSPRGALGVAQIMPQTAAQPGFGMKPLTPEELRDPEKNRAFGQEYFNRQTQYFGGDVEKGVAAYNAGAGRVQQAIARAEQTGQDWRTLLPQETQNYMRQVLGPVKAPAQQPVSPEQVAAAPAAPTAAPEAAQMQAAAPAVVGPGLKFPDGSTQGQYDILNSEDRNQILKLATDISTPPTVSKMAMDKLYGQIKFDRDYEKASQQVDSALAKGDVNTVLRNTAKKGEEGSFFKAVLYSRLGLNDLAQQEQQKISPSYKFSPVQLANDEYYSVQFNARTGEVVGAKDREGRVVTNEKKLGEIAAMALTAQQVGQSSATFYRDSQGNQWSQVPTERGPVFRNVATGQIGRPVGSIVPITAGSDLETYFRKKQMDINARLVGATQEARIKAYQDLNNERVLAGLTPLSVEQMGVSVTPTLQAPPSLAAPGVPTEAAPAAAPVQPQRAPAAVMPGAAPAAAARPPAAGPVVPGAAPAAVAPAVTPAPGVTGAGLQAQRQAAAAAAKEEATTGPVIERERQQAFVKYGVEDITPKADAGSQVARIRKQQINGPDGILANPELAGILQGQGGAFDEARNILRDLVTGTYKDGDELSRRVASLNLSQRQKDVLNTQIGLNLSLNPLTLKANAGPGAVSEAEHKLNNQANVDMTRVPLYSGLTLMTRSQFINDMAAARAAFKADRPDLNTIDKFNAAWNQEKARLEKEYETIYGERAKYIARYNKDGKNPGAVVDAFKLLPVPEFDSETRRWTYGGESERARRTRQGTERPPLGSFVK